MMKNAQRVFAIRAATYRATGRTITETDAASGEYADVSGPVWMRCGPVVMALLELLANGCGTADAGRRTLAGYQAVIAAGLSLKP